jgi:Ni/Co efflux regulator RcnB
MKENRMLSKRWLSAATAVLFALSGVSLAQGQGHGHGNGNGHGNKHDRDDDRDRQHYSERDRDYMRGWYHDHERNGHLPPGLAKRDQLPPGLERQLRVRGTLPPGLRKKMMPVPEEFEQRLPPPPEGCAHVFIGGNVVLVNRSSYVVLDIFHF